MIVHNALCLSLYYFLIVVPESFCLPKLEVVLIIVLRVRPGSDFSRIETLRPGCDRSCAVQVRVPHGEYRACHMNALPGPTSTLR